jgi:hypothetical protein
MITSVKTRKLARRTWDSSSRPSSSGSVDIFVINVVCGRS